MNQDKIHDALNLLDDDMIEVVENLRNKNKYKRKNLWVRYLSVAACICIVAAGIFAIGNLGLLSGGSKKQSNNDGTYNNNFGYTSEGEKNFIIKGQGGDIVTTGGEVPSVIVEIKKWQDNGFEGKIAGIVDTTIFEVGAEVVVEFDDDICIAETREGITKYIEDEPTEEDFPVGSKVCVQFVKTEKKRVGLFKKVDLLYAGMISEADE